MPRSSSGSKRRATFATTSIGKAGVEASFEDELRGDYGSQLVERDASGRLLDVIETVREPVPGKNLMLTIDGRIQRLATQALKWGMEAANVSQGVTVVMNPQTGEILAMVSLAVVRQQQVRLRHQHRGLQRLPGRSGATAAQPRDQRHLPARVDVQARHGHRRDGGGGDDPDAAVADVRLLPDPGRAEGRVPLRLESPGVRAARDGRRLREELRHLLLSDGRPHRRRPARPVGPRPRLRRAVRDPPAGRGGGDHRQHGVGPRPGA